MIVAYTLIVLLRTGAVLPVPERDAEACIRDRNVYRMLKDVAGATCKPQEGNL